MSRTARRAGPLPRLPEDTMTRIAKGLLLGQFIICALSVPLLFDVPLEMARVTAEARQLSATMAAQGPAPAAKQAADIAGFLRAWNALLPFAMVVPAVAGAIIGVIGWQALKQNDKVSANNGCRPPPDPSGAPRGQRG